ncbi:hypothetical protein BCR33DRAFT_720729 [Rhizoclosmatium globosum]|uniref:Uncharacterized protein n=1 Tax=Rhizoclosmatium globosum TaxID=329046 RepID=A0A1Y2BUF2_9FUNG|nr:hypothetical protein BCR33DRAFT_720729 [Rhizoclosmatium globosum]|eukprot:ORY38363.1 hypothetical protein BCR33DRAFT_720729 [Rhizoclosmatium globosum]
MQPEHKEINEKTDIKASMFQLIPSHQHPLKLEHQRTRTCLSLEPPVPRLVLPNVSTA